jgi:hypothetical protein
MALSKLASASSNRRHQTEYFRDCNMLRYNAAVLVPDRSIAEPVEPIILAGRIPAVQRDRARLREADKFSNASGWRPRAFNIATLALRGRGADLPLWRS